MQIYRKRSHIDAPVEQLFAFHENPGAFLRLNPPWEPVEMVEHTGGIRDGARVDVRLKLGGLLPVRWLLTHRNYIHNQQFEDAQVRGPFAHWVHTHRTESDGAGGSFLEDHIAYKLPLGIVGRVFGGAFAHAKLARMFTYRHAITAHDLAMHQAYSDQPRQTIAVTGSSGLVGSGLVPLLTSGGHRVRRLVRNGQTQEMPGAENALWDIEKGALDPATLRGVDAVVHLAGENIGGKRWTAAQKERILQSRLQGTRLLAETLAKLPADARPRVLVSASAIGYYGDTGDTPTTEDGAAGRGFMAEVCQAWEAALQPAIDAGIRVVVLRFGVILSMSGGALAQMLPPFRLGVGGVLGTGEQYTSWVSLDDVLGSIHFAIMNPTMQGVYNLTAPQPVTNREFTRTLARVLRRPALLPVPSFGLRLLFGALADELLLASSRIVPTRLQAAGYAFRYPQLEGALRHVLGA